MKIHFFKRSLTSSLSGCENTIGWPVSEASLILRCKGISPKRATRYPLVLQKFILHLEFHYVNFRNNI